MCKKSESIINLAIALAAFNLECPKIGKDSANSHFKNRYASLDNITDEIKPLLAKHGLSVIQMPGGDGEMFKMTTMLIHVSGEWIESEPLIMRPVKNDPQGIGSCSTYARRYGLSAVLGLSTGEDDDDGNGASQAPQNPYNRPASQSTQSTNQQSQQSSGQTGTSSSGSVKLATEGQVKLLAMKRKAAGFEGMVEINAYLDLNIESLNELPMSKVNELIKYLDDNKLPA
jgi:hypothetical protein